MSRPIGLFTGQWADLTLEEVARKASAWGFDALELACWGDHFEVDKALESDAYVQSRWDILNKYNLKMLRHQHAPGGAMRLRHRSTPATRASSPRACGATGIPKGCASAALRR